MFETDRLASRCPICGSLLELDEERGYSCPDCGWDECAGLENGEVWIVPGERGDKDTPD